MSIFKLDRTAFKAHSMTDASDHAHFYQKKSWQERLRIAAYLNSVAFNYPIDNPPTMDRTKFKAGSSSSNG